MTAPYFHNGSAKTLKNVINQHQNVALNIDGYNLDGSFRMGEAEIDAISPILLQATKLSVEEISKIIQFLGVLEDRPANDWTKISIPVSVPSGLLVQADRKHI